MAFSKWGNGFHWPNGEDIAVVFNVSWETWPKTLGTARNNQRAGEVVAPDAKYGRWMMPVYEHAYAETGGAQRLLDVWARHGIKSSWYVDGLNVELYPELSRQAIAEGHEFLVQGWDHAFLWEQTVAEQEDSLKRTYDCLKRVLDYTPEGFSASAGSITPETFDIVEKLGMSYCCGFRNCDVPFIIKRKSGKSLVGMNSYAISDFNSYGFQDQDINVVLRQWRDFFDVLHDEGRRGRPQFLAYGTHPLLSHGFRTKPLEDTIEYVKSKGNVWITTRQEIAAYMHETFPDLTLDTFFPEAVAQDKWYGLSSGVGGEEAEAEALRYRVE